MAASSLREPQKHALYRYLDLVMAAFVSVLIVSNIASSAKIISFGFSICGVPMAFDGGTILFPLSYIFGDILTEVYGFKASRRVIWTGFVALALTAGVFALLGLLPSDSFWNSLYTGDGTASGQAAYGFILGGMGSGGIVLASLVAYWAGAFSNSAILSRMKVAMGGRMLWARTIGSTLVGQAVDTGIFILVATFLGVFQWGSFLSLLLTNYIFKCLVEAFMTPATYAAVRALKKAEGVDAYDRAVKLNPFSIK